jgi:hypothetical protein
MIHNNNLNNIIYNIRENNNLYNFINFSLYKYYDPKIKKILLKKIFNNNRYCYNEFIIPFIHDLVIFKNNLNKYIDEKDLISIKDICYEMKDPFIFLNITRLYDHIINAFNEILYCNSENMNDYHKKIYFFIDFDYNDFINDLLYEPYLEIKKEDKCFC